MSKYWRAHCVDCGSSHDFPYSNHQEKALLQLIQDAPTLSQLADVGSPNLSLEVTCGLGYLQLDWWREHGAHQLVAMSEYGDQLSLDFARRPTTKPSRPLSIIQGAIRFARSEFWRDGAEGETVHLLCDELEHALRPCQWSTTWPQKPGPYYFCCRVKNTSNPSEPRLMIVEVHENHAGHFLYTGGGLILHKQEWEGAWAPCDVELPSLDALLKEKA